MAWSGQVHFSQRPCGLVSPFLACGATFPPAPSRVVQAAQPRPYTRRLPSQLSYSACCLAVAASCSPQLARLTHRASYATLGLDRHRFPQSRTRTAPAHQLAIPSTSSAAAAGRQGGLPEAARSTEGLRIDPWSARGGLRTPALGTPTMVLCNSTTLLPCRFDF